MTIDDSSRLSAMVSKAKTRNDWMSLAFIGSPYFSSTASVCCGSGAKKTTSTGNNQGNKKDQTSKPCVPMVAAKLFLVLKSTS